MLVTLQIFQCRKTKFAVNVKLLKEEYQRLIIIAKVLFLCATKQS